MRKIFVVLLVLAIAGGAFAQDSDGAKKGTWGTWSGSIDMSTEFNLSYLDPEQEKDLADDVNSHDPTTITGDQGGIELKLQWDYAKDNWTVAIPFVINKDDGVIIDGAKVEYADGPLTVAVPFGVNIGNFIRGKSDFGSSSNELEENDILGIPQDADTEYQFKDIFKDIHIEAKYETDTYAFGAGMNNIFKDIAEPSDFKAWGWYDFDILAGARLAVSYGGGYATEWWRASTIVLDGSAKFWNDEGIDTNLRWAKVDDMNKYGNYLDLDDDGFYFKETGYGYHWGNIADTGLAFKLNITPEFNFGFAFASTKMFEGGFGGSDAVAPNPDSNVDAQGWLIGDNFFRNILFGLGFDNDMLSASAMFGLKPAKNKEGDPSADVYIHAGLKVNVMEGLSIGADISMVGYAAPKAYPVFKEPGKFDKIETEDNPLAFNLGAEVDFKSDVGFWANLKFAAIDLANKTNFSVDPGYTHLGGYEGRFDAAEIINVGMNWGLGFQLGYDADLSETLALGISAGVVVKDEANTTAWSAPKKGDSVEKDLNYFYLGVEPVLTWQVVENGTIEFKYTFGFETQEEVITNKLGIGFKWSF